MALTPSPLENDGGVFGVQVQVEAAVDVVDVADLTAAGGVQGNAGEEREAFLLEAGGADGEAIGVRVGYCGECFAERVVGLAAAGLVDLALWCDAFYGWSGAASRGDEGGVAAEVACRGTDGGGDGRGRVGVF